MATEILAPSETHQYKLPEIDCQAIREQASNPRGESSPITQEEIEQQRLAFIREFGNEFGQ